MYVFNMYLFYINSVFIINKLLLNHVVLIYL